jgi:Holliday junction resolvase RusA-like endonuclease
MNVLTARVFGLPVAQPRARARAFAVGGQTRIQMYDPPQAKDWKRTVQAQVLSFKPSAPAEGPLAMRLVFHLPRPQSLPKREQWPTKRPDLDNLTKGVKDALRGVIYRDDSLIVRFAAAKVYGTAPGVVIVIDRVLEVPRLEQGELVLEHLGAPA